ncbi:multidrug resistance protein [Vibrio sp. MACH09]|uniref:efflux RND transporter permease subunit n=1 Tax=Vibrio sp. MACH09 TaxID=3025122 RepID=UPI00279513E8|nr:efflux RND transporter permease subunit [Vibrio sp. MACH09]GLO60602.1 multidrug resistance protein [Vibrio sp. MACH09]
MNSVISFSIERSRTFILLLIILIFVGAASYALAPKESDPDVPLPFISISVSHDGISPEDAERLLLRPIEKKLNDIEGIKEMLSDAYEGGASISLEFEPSIKKEVALANVRQQVELGKSELPPSTDAPIVKEITLAAWAPALTVVLSGSVPESTLITLSKSVRDDIETFPEVLAVDIGGERKESVEVLLDPMLLESYQLDHAYILGLLSRNNRLIAAGNMDNGKGRLAIKVPSVFENISDILSMPIKVSGDKVVTFGDIGTIRRVLEDPISIARLNGEYAITLDVKKRAGENTIETVSKVRQLIGDLSQSWPNSIEVSYVGDTSVDVKNMLSDLQNNVASAVILVVLVIVVILGWRSAAFVGVAIPGAFLTGIILLVAFGMTINIVVLFGLIMAVGMLVDGAIVVTEYAVKEMASGEDKKVAYQTAARRMSWPIIASTATTLAAFFPLLFWPGIMGDFMKYLPLTLIFTLVASLFMALIFVPTLGAVFAGNSKVVEQCQKVEVNAPVQQVLQAHLDKSCAAETANDSFEGNNIVLRVYGRALTAVVRSPLATLIVALLFSVSVIMLYSNYGKGVVFFPKIDTGTFNLTIRSPADLSIYEKSDLMREVEMRLLDIDSIESLYSRVSTDNKVGMIRGNLVPWQEREHLDVIVAEVRRRLDGISGIKVEVRGKSNGPNNGKALMLEVSATNLNKLQPALNQLKRQLNSMSELVNVTDDGEQPSIEWKILVDREKASSFGADPTIVGSSVQMLTTGLVVGSYRPDDSEEELDIRVRYPKQFRHLDNLENIRVNTPQGMVPISNFADVTPDRRQPSIHKVDGEQVLTIQADLAEGVQLDSVLSKISSELITRDSDPDVQISFKGENEDQQESQTFLVKAFLGALFMMGLILVTQFNSFYQAFLILSAVLFSTVGVFLGLLVSQQPFGIVMGGLGIISLAGIVVNNNIVLIDTFNQFVKEGKSVHDAIVTTGLQRLRPVLMTTVTTVLGLLPMVLEMNIDLFNRSIEFGAPIAKFWVQLASTVAGGLIFATVLTLLITPSLLALRYNKRGAING